MILRIEASYNRDTGEVDHRSDHLIYNGSNHKQALAFGLAQAKQKWPAFKNRGAVIIYDQPVSNFRPME